MKYIYYPVIRPQAITKSEKFTFSKSVTNFLLVFLFTFLGFTDAFGQGANCGAAVAVNVNTEYTAFSLTDATVNDPTEAAVNGQTMQRDGWFSFVSNGTEASIRVFTTNRNPMIFAYSGVCGGLSQIGSVNALTGTGGHTEILNLTGLTNGVTYYVRVGNSTANNMAISSFHILTNDRCANALLLTSNTSCTTTNGSTVGATDNNETGDCTTGTENAVWYQFQAVSTNHTITVDGIASFDVVLQVINTCGAVGNPAGGTCVDATADGGIETLTLTGLTPGNFYKIQIHDFNGDLTANGFTICITHLPIPTITSLGAANGCVGSSLVITGTNLTGATAVTIGGTAATITGNTATTVTVTVGTGTTGTVQVTTPGGAATSAATFTVNPLPAAIAGGSATVCTGASTPAFTSATGGGTWSVIAGTGTASITSPAGVLTGTTVGTVTVRYTLPTGCFVTSGTITIQQTPGAIAGGSATVCNGASTPAFSNPNAGGTWSVVNGTGTATITGGGVLTGTSAGTVTVRYTIGTCTPATFNVTVNPSPNATIGGGALTVCTGGTTPAFTNSVGGGTWSITNGTGSATISAGGVVTGVTVGTATVVYSIGTCTASTPITVITIPATVVGPTPANAAINVCYAGAGAVSSISWTASASATSYDVYFGAGSLPGTVTANVATNTYTTGALAASTTYYWRVVAKNSCGDAVTSATFTFTTAALSCDPIVYCTPIGVNNTFSISNVTFAGINNNSPVLVNVAGPDYEDFSAITGNVTAGSTYNISVNANGLSPNLFYVYAYFDWNNNGNFTDDGGAYTIGTYTTNTATLNLNILIPITAYVGTIRMRVGNSFNAIYDPCITVGGNFQFEDYSLNIASAPPCTEPTTQPTTLVLTAGTPSGTALNGSFTAAAPAPQNYLVVMNTTGTAPTGLIMDGTTYPIGSSIGVGNTVVDTDSNTTFIATGLNPSTTYYFFIYSLNALCTGGPLYNTNPTVLIGNATTSTGAPTYCTPVTTLGQNDDKYINRVAFIGTLIETNNTSTFSNVTPGYQDFTGLAAKAQQAQGEGVNMIVESIGGRTRLHAWVDWNKNGTYEASEMVYGPPAAGISSTFGFVIPSGAVPGDYRIRVRTFNSYYNDGNGANGNPDEYFGLNFDACQLFNTGTVSGFASTQYGEAEDYLFTVIQKCDANITSVVDGSVCGSGVVDLIANGTAGTTQIRWYTALTGGVSIGTSTSGGTFETPSIAVTTTYYCTAWNGTCESFVRTPVIARVNPTPTLTFTQSSPDVCGENAIVSLTVGGDKQLTDLLYERFEGGLGAFTNVNSDPSPAAVKADTQWMARASTFVPTAGDSWKPAISSGLAPNSFALATSDSGTPPEVLVENSLTSVTLNSTSYLNLTMTMKFYYSRYFPDNTNNADEFVSIQISTNGGGAWTTLQTFTADTGIGTKFTELSYGLNAYINQTNLKVRVLHHSLGSITGWLPDGVAVDDIKIFGEVPLNTAFVWSGASLPDVYSNPAATTPYIAGSPVVTVYVKPTLAQLEMGSYTFTATAVLSNGCTASQDITLLNKSKIWKGSVDNNWYNANNWNPIGIPDANTCVIIPDIANTFNRPSEINTVGSNAFGKTLEVKNNGRLNIYSANNLTIGNTINVAGAGLINMENSANLVQIANVVNTGNINMKRTANVRRQDYVYWSSPVAGFANSAVSPGTSLGYQYKWLPTTGGTNNFGNWTFTNETMVLGKGYCLRAPDSYSLSAFANYTASFIGVPNNGNITIPISRGNWNGGNYSTGVSTTLGTNADDNWNLVGNPYPSAIDAIKFLTLNPSIAGFVNIWTHGSLPSNAVADPFYNDYAYNYTPTDYITYNSSGSSSGAGTFNGFIGAGQGFFISMLHAAATPANLIFNNDLRRDIPTGNTYNNGQFFRTGNENSNAIELERHRIWLDLVTPSGKSARSLVGYIQDATNENDRLFDAFSNEKLSFNIFSLINDEQMLIQGRKLPFDANDKVQIGVSIPQDGLYRIAIGSVDGLFLDKAQDIYLEDKLLNIIYNLKTAPYSFMDKKGTIKDRFVLRFSKEASSNTIEVTNQVSVYENKVLTVESSKLNIKNIQVFDILGKQLLNKNDINSKTYQLNNLNRTNSLMIVKVTLEDNSEETRKVIY